MTIETTGSTVWGMNDGLRGGLVGPTGPTIRYVNGNPDGIVTSPDSSGLAIDWTNGNLYMQENTNGSTWIVIGSTV